MKCCVSILRGINVGGNRIIKMDALRELYGELGYSHIQTYIQSGNAVFQCSDPEAKDSASVISSAIARKFGLEVPVLVMEADDYRQIIGNNPFPADPARSAEYMHVTFLREKPDPELLKNIPSGFSGKDEFHLADKVIYLYCPNGYGKTRLTNGYFENLLNCPATTRNWKTALELLRMTLNSPGY